MRNQKINKLETSGWINLTFIWGDLERIAAQRDAQKQNYKSTKNWSAGNSTHFLGLVAEAAFSVYSGMDFDESLNAEGDPGYDFIVDGKTIDVKGTQYFNDPHLKQYPNPKTWADYYVLVGIDIAQKRAKIFGHATKEEMQNASLRDYGYGPQRVIGCSELHKIEELNFS